MYKPNWIPLGFLVWMLLMSNGCIAAMFGVGGATAGYDSGQQDALASDPVIVNAVKAKYFDDNLLKTLSINIDINEGVITLYGKVPDDNAQHKAIDVAKGVEGVKEVRSHLVVMWELAGGQEQKPESNSEKSK